MSRKTRPEPRPEMLPIAGLTPHPGNARKHSDEQIRALARAIEAWGFTQPVVVDGANTILIGHGRVEAARRLGMTEVPVIRRPDLDATAARALVLADNRLHELGASWDADILDAEVRYLAGERFDLSLAVLDLPEMKLAEDAPPPPLLPPEPGTRPGDVWTLGPHRLVVGTESGDVAQLSALCAVAAPGLVVTRLVHESPADLSAVIAASGANAAYVWHEPHAPAAAVSAVLDAGLDIRCQIICPEPAPSARRSGYIPGHVCGVYAGRSGSAKWRGGRTQSSVWEAPGAMARTSRALTNHLAQGGAVLDPFCLEEDGVIFRAASQTQRRALGCVDEPVHADTIIRRWQAFTGERAVHAETGVPFGD